ncbi:hypothetical protein [Streptomyces sp. 769]|uniref:hypothetical protein n=1 Tax=Streptomyces sp. 769 TaxID=1262452 RepID=UPI0005806021|nr:hypothetical protein [Streptomyces sp. 769]
MQGVGDMRQQAVGVRAGLLEQRVQGAAVGGLEQLARHAVGRRRAEDGEFVVDVGAGRRRMRREEVGDQPAGPDRCLQQGPVEVPEERGGLPEEGLMGGEADRAPPGTQALDRLLQGGPREADGGQAVQIEPEYQHSAKIKSLVRRAIALVGSRA